MAIRGLIILLALITFSVGCSSKKPVFVPGTVKVAVLDGKMAEGKEETRKAIVGYWLNSRDRFESGTANLILADELADSFATIPGVEVRPREDVRTMMAQKERLLSRQFGDFSPSERRNALSDVDPILYGKSLDVDYVLVPIINKSRLVHNRAFYTWMSSVDCVVEIYHVDSGELTWYWEGEKWENFASTTNIIEDLALEAIKDACGESPFEVSSSAQTISAN